MLSLLNNAQSLVASYIRIRSSASSATNPELREARNELENTLHELSADLEDLIESIKAAEQDQYRYGLETEEIERRRRLVADISGEVASMRAEMNKEIGALKGTKKGEGMSDHGKSVNGEILPSPTAFADPDGDNGIDDAYGAFEQERQMELMQEQDQALDGVFKTVGNLRQQADSMGRELEEQGELLDEVDVVTDRVGGKLQTGLKKVGWVLKKNEGKSLVGIGFSKGDVTDPSVRHNVNMLYRHSHICFDIAFDPHYRPLSTQR